MANFSKISRTETSSDDVPYESIYRIAKMRIVDKRLPKDIALELNIKYSYVRELIASRKQHNLWLDAIAALGREGLIK